MKKLILAAAMAGTTSLTQALPLVNLDIGAGAWRPDYSGDLGVSDTNVEDLGLSEETANVYYATLEFPLPLIPAIKVERTELETDGQANLNVDFTLEDFTFNANGDVTTDLDLTHNDVTIYWGLPKFYLDVDFGVTLRQFDGEAAVTGQTTVNGVTAISTETVDLDVIIPLAFADIRLDLPLTGLYGRVEGNILSIGDNSLTDFTAVIGYNTDALPILFDLEFEAGYREMSLTLDNEDLEADVSIGGPYLGMQIAF